MAAVSIQITKQMMIAMKERRTTEPLLKEAMQIISNQWNVDDTDFNYNTRPRECSIEKIPHNVLTKLADAFRLLIGVRGHMVAVRTINTWVGAAEMFKGEFKPAKTCMQGELILRGFFAKQEVRRIYRQDADDGRWHAYYVERTEYHPPVRGKDYYAPPYITVHVAYRELDVVHTTYFTIYETQVVGSTPVQMLRKAKLFIETEELRAAYLEEFTRWRELIVKIGHQCLGRGRAEENVDGNRRHSDAWYWRSNTVTLDPQGEPSRVVIDVFSEEDNSKSKNSSVNFTFWDEQKTKLGLVEAKEGADPSDTGDDDGEVVTDEEDGYGESSDEDDGEEHGEAKTPVEVPTYPTLVVFDMRKHRRVSVHVTQLEDYVYDTKLGSKLILPAEVRDLLHVLLTQRSLFQDVIAGKSGGVCVLCYGPPGTGKTLTSEVYSEVMKRPLYAVQTSQLGMNATELENELRRVFARAQRWGAILLLDEADVYVRARGDDLHQNAIVGVFLRTMEYYQGVMFLTTNRIDLIDDAIESRCIAKIPYLTPHPNDQRAIWRVQADQSGTKLPDDEIDRIVEAHSDLSGRDIKNLLKLAKMIASYYNKPVTVDTITFVKRFKPTSHKMSGEYAGEGGALTLPTPVRKPRADEDE